MNSAGVPHSRSAGPFGYSFFQNDSNSIPTNPTAVIPSATYAPTSGGPTLFNKQEEDYMNSFFESHNAVGQEMSSHGFELAIQNAQNELHGSNMTQFGWLMNEQPPTFVNASATPKQPSAPLPYQNMAHHGSIDFGNHHFGDPNDMLGGNPYQQMLAQAAAMQNVHMGHGQMQPPQHTPSLVSAPSTEASEMLHTADALPHIPSSSQPPLLSLIPTTTLATHEIRDLLAGNALNFAGLTPLETGHDGLVDAGPRTAPARLDEIADGRLYRFGSDSHFGLDGFKPSSMNERHDYIADRLTKELHMLKPINRSNVPTRASSPTHQQQLAGLHASHMRKQSAPNAAIKHEDDDSSHISRPKKRRKDDESDDDNSPAAKRKFSVPHPKLRRVSSSANDLSPGAAKRRRSSVTASGPAGKAARENLSEEQKRSNHIQSEQKRRNLIKTGFDELRRIVPELRGGGLSKSMELMEVSNFLEQVINANKLLRGRLGIVEPV